MNPALPIQRPAGEAGAASGDRGHHPGGAVEPGIMEPGITWYDILGVLPGAEARKIKQKYDAKAALLRPEPISGAPPNVLTAVTRAQELLDTAWEVLGDPERRKRYDEGPACGVRAEAWGSPGPASNRPGWRRPIRTSSVSCLA